MRHTTPLKDSFRMLYVIVIAICGFALGFCDPLPADEELQFSRRIVTPAVMQAGLKESVDDLRGTLSRITGVEFDVETWSGSDNALPANGIILCRSDAEGASAEAVKRLHGSSRESVVLWPDGGRLWLISPTDIGLCHAVYFYLEKLGCRWYFPAEKWTFLPSLQDIRITAPLVKAPAFQSRVFFGTGGFGGDLPLDSKRSLQARWAAWERRNRFGGQFRISGHSGEAFNMRHQKELEEHSEWRAELNGKREPWSLSTKLCVGNNDAVALYVKDRIDEFRTQQKQNPESPWAWAVSVDPADGGGHCTAPESVAIGSVSDRVFHVANQGARELRKEFPHGAVSLFAYGEHAAVPAIPLEPNVYVMVIPYAFQRTGLTPDELLTAWSRKVPRMGVYDYWSIPDWTHDLPDFDPFEFGARRMRSWQQRGIDGFIVESTYSSGGMGLGWLIASQLAWDTAEHVDDIEAEFVSRSFGGAKEPLRRMFRRWSLGFCLTSHELALSYRDLQDACELTREEPDYLARVLDFGRYLEYLRRRYEYGQQELAPTADRTAAAERLMQTMWRMYDSSMIHAFRLSQLLIRDETNRKNPELGTKYDYTNQDAPVWKQIQPFSDREVRELIEDGVRSFQPRGFSARRYTGDLTRKLPVDRSNAETASDGYFPDLWLNDSFEGHLLVERPGETCRFRIASEQEARVTLANPAGEIVFDQTIPKVVNSRENWSEVMITVPAVGLYRLAIDSPKRMYRLGIPATATLTMRWWTNSQGTPTPRIYFYVPEGVERAAIYTDYIDAGLPRFFDPQGMQVQPETYDNGHLIVIPIPAQDRGRVWSLDQAKMAVGPLRMLNVPNAFAMEPSGLLVPEDALMAR